MNKVKSFFLIVLLYSIFVFVLLAIVSFLLFCILIITKGIHYLLPIYWGEMASWLSTFILMIAIAYSMYRKWITDG